LPIVNPFYEVLANRVDVLILGAMQNELFEIRLCANPACGLRYSRSLSETRATRCPNCHSDTHRMGELYGQHEISDRKWNSTGPVLEVLLDNIRSAWNVGSMLRAADGAGIKHFHLCGISPRPDNAKVMKTALGAERSVTWSYHPNGLAFCQDAKMRGYQLWALEGGPRAESLFDLETQDTRPILLVVGNELTGVDPDILAECEKVVCLPMMGEKGSLNVAVAFGAAVYSLRFGGKLVRSSD
jgi:23S rRNA (guanosine2251-2'-O)-methyltransferase